MILFSDEVFLLYNHSSNHYLMKLVIPKLSVEKLSQKELDVLGELSSLEYGQELASQVANKLMAMEGEGLGLRHHHRDYCGMGLYYKEGIFILSTVYDGYGPDAVIAEFESYLEFVNWLSSETDQSMALYGERFNNQTITKLRIDWFLEEDYSPVWNSYCEYVRNK